MGDSSDACRLTSSFEHSFEHLDETPRSVLDVDTSLPSWLEKEMRRSPVWIRNETLCRNVLNEIVPRWISDFEGELQPCWNKISKRLVKELNECEPFMMFVIDKSESVDTAPFVLVDLCSGFGVMSLLLSELLSPEKVPMIWLLDKSFPLQGYPLVAGRHITVDHIVHRNWPIPLRYRKVDIKKGRELRQLQQHNVFGSYPVLLVGVHLCKSLSVHAIQFYHSMLANENQTLGLLLKPCCLPGRKNLYTSKGRGPTVPIEYSFDNGYSFQPRALYAQDVSTPSTESDSEDVSDTDDAIDQPGHARTSNKRFSGWMEHLRRGCLSSSCRCYVRNIAIQKNYFQNQFLFCETVKDADHVEDIGSTAQFD